MMLISGQSNRIWHYWAGRYPGSVGVLISPSYMRKVPIDPWMPFVLDNGAFIAWRDNQLWDENSWLEMLTYIRQLRKQPLWVVVPDVVANRVKTIENWTKYYPVIKRLGWRAAFAVQDGMTIGDVPINADVVFVGGSDKWKFRNLPIFTQHFKHVHCARVNSQDKIEACERLGCESVDGTGWFREPSNDKKLPMLERFITGHRRHIMNPSFEALTT